MTTAEQNKFAATRLIIELLDYAVGSGDPAAVEHIAQETLDAIANYTIAKAAKQLAQQRNLEQDLKRIASTTAPSTPRSKKP